MSSPLTRAFYLSCAKEPVYALLDKPAANSTPNTGVLLCPLFGNDDLCAYRARREWAKTLAAAGHPTLRIDLPATGDSPGCPHDPGLLEQWVDAVLTAAAWLRCQPRCTRVSAIGIGLGGLLAYRALVEGAPIDDLVLWSVPARGRTLVRQLRVLSQMEASHDTAADGDTPALPPGALASAGFVMSAETVAGLEQLDLAQLELPAGAPGRVLLLERDGLKVDERLREALQRAGAQVTLAPGRGYGTMVAPPQKSRSPVEVFHTVGEWLLADTGESVIGAPERVPATAVVLDLMVAGVHIRETPLTTSSDGEDLMGVLSQPDEPAPLCAVLLNAGALRHTGPNRMWVEIARRWAALGVPTVRIDLTGIGDSDGDAYALEDDEGFYTSRYVSEVRELLSAFSDRDLPARFVLAGLCSGAYWAFHAALEDERVRGALMINPRALFWDPNLSGVRDARAARKALRLSSWRKLLRGQITRERVGVVAQGVGVALASLPGRLRTRAQNGLDGGDELGRALQRIGTSEMDLFAVFTAEEPMFEELERNGDLQRLCALPNVHVESIPGPPTSHTLEPMALQHAVHELLDEALVRILEELKATEATATDGARRMPIP